MCGYNVCEARSQIVLMYIISGNIIILQVEMTCKYRNTMLYKQCTLLYTGSRCNVISVTLPGRERTREIPNTMASQVPISPVLDYKLVGPNSGRYNDIMLPWQHTTVGGEIES